MYNWNIAQLVLMMSSNIGSHVDYFVPFQNSFINNEKGPCVFY